jgi:uncharacterized repeat protein (TIGR02543 family)/LPXTG-motif cell wall-anchored protein
MTPSTSSIYFNQSTSGVQANATWTITIAAGALTMGNGTNVTFFVSTSDGANNNPTIRDTGSAPLAFAGSGSSTVTYNSNGGSGAMANQSASTSTALSANAFTRSGYTFSGWNTAANGSGTAYADGASYAFSSSTTLYAQWTPTLATTGIDSKPYLYTAFAFAIAGAALMLLSSRRKQNI